MLIVYMENAFPRQKFFTWLAVICTISVPAVVIFAFPGNLIAQQSETYRSDSAVFPSEGGVVESQNYQIDTTIGDPSSSTLQSESYTATVGFQAADSTLAPTQPPPSQPSILTTIVDIVDKTKDEIKKILPSPIENAIGSITTSISDAIEDIRGNNDVSSTVDQVIEPVSTTAAILTAAGVVTTGTSLQLTNIFYLLARFGYFWLVPLTLGKRRKPWGVVFDSTTGKPVRGALVRIYSKEFSKLKETQITDDQGRFGFLVDMGQYYVTVSHPGYIYPSRLLTTAVASEYEHIYRVETITIRERIEAAISINIPLDPEDRQLSRAKLGWMRLLNIFGMILEKINTPLLIAGTAISWITLIIQPKLSNYIVLAVYGALIIFKLLLVKNIQQSWGKVNDAATNSPVELAVVRVYNISNGSIVTTKITNRQGQFSVLVPPGIYYLMVIKAGYESFQSHPVTVSKQRGMITLAVRLNKFNPTPATLPQFSPAS